MPSFQRILLVLDPSLQPTPAQTRALALAATYKAEVWIGLFDPGAKIGYWDVFDPAGALRVEHQMRDQQSTRLLELVNALRDRTGLAIQLIDERERPTADRIVMLVQRHQIDLVIKDAHHDSALKRLVVRPLDWELLRRCPVPVWLVGTHEQAQPRRIAAAVDPVHPEHGAGGLSDVVLDTASSLATQVGAQLHVYSVFAGLPPELPALDLQGLGLAFPYDELYERLNAQHREAFQRLMSRHQLARDSGEILFGPPAPSLVEALERFQPDVLVIGTSHRHGLDRLFMGSTAEQLAADARCDLLAIPPEQVPTA